MRGAQPTAVASCWDVAGDPSTLMGPAIVTMHCPVVGVATTRIQIAPVITRDRGDRFTLVMLFVRASESFKIYMMMNVSFQLE